MDFFDALERTEATAVRGAQVFIFPESEIVRRFPPADQVSVTHRGETQIYDSPSALYAAFVEADPERKARLAQAQRIADEADVKLARATVILAAALDRRRQAERLLNLVLCGFIVAGVLGLGLLMTSL